VDVEDELARLLHARDVPLQVPDPVAAVHAGMRRRRRVQRLQVLTASAGVLVLAVGAALVVRPHVTGSQQPARQPSTNAVSPTTEPVGVPAGFAVRDLSFVSTTTGWALGVVPCTRGECGVLIATDDGGRSWVRRALPALAVTTPDGGCVSHCVSRLRFVQTPTGEQVGYAYGPDLAVTHDGGRTWATEPVAGSVVGLEAGRSGVVRLVDPQRGCPCATLTVQRADVGSSDWQTLLTPPPSGRQVDSGSLVRQGNRLAVLLRGHTAGGAMDARSQLLLSSDGGTTWVNRQEMCGPLSADEVDTTQVALAPGGVVAVLCRHRMATPHGGDTFVRVSTDGGVTFSPARPVPAPDSSGLLTATRAALVVTATREGSTAERLLRSTDGGRTWKAVQTQVGTSPNGSAFLGFTTDQVGTWVGPDPRVVWRTDDGGATWTARAVR
jgi:photosystem II stability/assembly factor-like uncharacterized protein